MCRDLNHASWLEDDITVMKSYDPMVGKYIGFTAANRGRIVMKWDFKDMIVNADVCDWLEYCGFSRPKFWPI